MSDESNPEFKRFTELVDNVISVPHSEIRKRMDEYREEVERLPNRRGPKRKPLKEPSSSRAPDASR